MNRARRNLVTTASLGAISLTFATMAAPALAEEIRPGVYRTPDARFENLPDFDYEPHYLEIDGYRVAYLDEGPADGEVILLLHGEPTWSYLYRKMIPVLVEAGHRCIVPDLIGFGRSDKPASMDTHTYKFHVDAMTRLVEALDLKQATFFGQDWGSLIGLRVVAENEERFARVVLSNAGLPVGGAAGPEDFPENSAFIRWKRRNQAMIDAGDIPTGRMLATNTGDPSIAAAYDAPFPEPAYKAGALIMPQRVPVFADDPANEANRKAWEVFERWEKPFLTAYGDSDPITRGGEVPFQRRVPGAQGQPHVKVEGAGHFIQETHGEELAGIINEFIAANPLPSDAELALVAINVADLERSEKYYGEVLGFKRVWTYPSDGNDVIEIGLAPPGGGATLVLAHLNDDPLPEGKGSYGRIIVNTANAKALAKKAEAAGSALRWVTIPGDNPPTIVFFRDPDGYEIELYQAASQ